MKVVPFALVPALLTISVSCGVAPRDDDAPSEEADDSQEVAPVVLNIGIDQLAVARFDLDLEAHIARFTAPAATLPLDRVSIFTDDEIPEDLNNAIARCNDLWGYEVTGGSEFVVGQGEDLITEIGAANSSCVACGFAVICPGHCTNLGPGEVPRGDPSSYDTDPSEGDTGINGGGSGDGGDEGGSSGSGGTSSGSTSGGSTSGGSTGGSGGASGGVGQPGGWD